MKRYSHAGVAHALNEPLMLRRWDLSHALTFVWLAGGTAGHRVKVVGLSIGNPSCSMKGTGFLRSDGGSPVEDSLF